MLDFPFKERLLHECGNCWVSVATLVPANRELSHLEWYRSEDCRNQTVAGLVTGALRDNATAHSTLSNPTIENICRFKPSYTYQGHHASIDESDRRPSKNV